MNMHVCVCTFKSFLWLLSLITSTNHIHVQFTNEGAHKFSIFQKAPMTILTYILIVAIRLTKYVEVGYDSYRKMLAQFCLIT